MTAFYNEHDPKAAAWLRELIAQGHIAPGVVDERSIEDVTPNELVGFTQCHFFAGIGVWSYALRQAGWEDNRPVWTGSCPCQPFSAAGKGDGFDDERHLWPAWHWLIEQLGPAEIFGEQVASADGLAWLDLVSSDLDGAGYACGAVDTCAAGFGAAHIRQRLYFNARRMADPERLGWERWRAGEAGGRGSFQPAIGSRDAGGVAVSDGHRLQGRTDRNLSRAGRRDEGRETGRGSGAPVERMADADGGNASAERQQRGGEQRQQPQDGGAGGVADPQHTERWPVDVDGEDGRDRPDGGWQEAHGVAGARGQVLRRPSPTNGLWRDADWLLCRDGKWRPVEPGTFPLAHGAPARVGRLRGYGNAINAAQAQGFIEAAMNTA